MKRNQRSTALYPSPFSRAYWVDALSELKSTRMLVVTALLVALRIALKPFAIPLAPQLSIQTAMLATALGAMIFGPVVAIPAAIISDTIGFLLWPTGDYFLPFVLTEIASTMIYALCFYRAKVTPFRVMLSRFFICFFVNVVLQQVIFAWQYMYLGNPESAKNAVLGIMATARVFKNLAFFPIESIVLTLFLRLLIPITNRMQLTYSPDTNMKFTRRQIAALVCLTVIGVGTSIGYLTYRYDSTSRSADFTKEQRIQETKEASQIVQELTDQWDDKTVIGIVSKANRPLFASETAYTIDVYILDEDAFAAKAEETKDSDSPYTMDTIYGYSLSPAKKDKALIRVATATYVQNEKTGQVEDFQLLLTD